MVGVYRSALTHVPQAACEHIGTIFTLGITDTLTYVKAPVALGNSRMVIVFNNNIWMNVIFLQLLHNAFYALFRLGMAAEQTVFGTAALLGQIIQLPHGNQHAVRVIACCDTVFYAFLIGTALICTAVAGKQRLLRCLHKSHALSAGGSYQNQRGPHLLFNRIYCVLLGYVSHLMAKNTGQLHVCRHVVNQSLIHINKAAGTGQGIDLIVIEHLEGKGDIITSANLRQSLADAVNSFLQRSILRHAVLSLQLLCGLLAHFNFLLSAD